MPTSLDHQPVHDRAGRWARAFLFFGPTRHQTSSTWLRRWFRWRRTAAVGLVVFLLGVSVFSWMAWRRSWQTPEWWSPLPSGIEVARSAEQFEQRVINEGHRVRGLEDSWDLVIDEAGANGWLSTRLMDWMRSQVPPVSLGEGVRTVRVMFRAGVIYAAAELDGGRIVTVGVSPKVDERGRLVLTIRSASVGRLGLPAAWAARALSPGSKGGGLRAEGGGFAVDEPVLKLADGRRVRMVGLDVKEESLLLRFKTLGR